MSDSAYDFDSSVLNDGLRFVFAFRATSGRGYYLHLDFAPEYLEELSSFDFISQYGYVMGFYPLDDNTPKSPSEDQAIGATVCAILKTFIQDRERVVVLYHCDASDGKQRARKCLFSQWRRKYGQGVTIFDDHIKLDVQDAIKGNRNEYLGYYALCNEVENEKIKVEFTEFANQKVASMK